MLTFIISTFLLIIYITLDIIYDSQLWKINTELTLYLQSNTFYGEQEMFSFFSNWSTLFQWMAIAIFLFTHNKLNVLVYFSIITFARSLNGLLKNIYHQVRPFWIVNEIQALQCNKDFGKPSGHAMQSLMLVFVLPLILLPPIISENLKYRKVIFVLIYIISSICLLLTGTSRIFLGQHSIGQVILGWIYSTYVLINYIVYLHQPMTTYIKQKLSGESSGISTQMLIKLEIAFDIWIVLSLIFFLLNSLYIFITPQEINQWFSIFYIKCQDDQVYTLYSSNVLQNFCFNDSLQIIFCLFLIIGIKITNGNYNEEQFIKNYKYLSTKQKLLRILIFLILLALVIPFWYLESFNLIVNIFCITIPYLIISALLMTLGYSKALYRFSVNVEGDFLYIERS